MLEAGGGDPHMVVGLHMHPLLLWLWGCKEIPRLIGAKHLPQTFYPVSKFFCPRIIKKFAPLIINAKVFFYWSFPV